MLTEPPQNPVKNREKLIEKMFETYQFGAANVSIQAMLTLYAQVTFSYLNMHIMYMYMYMRELMSVVAKGIIDGFAPGNPHLCGIVTISLCYQQLLTHNTRFLLLYKTNRAC